jgi:hypothetical protein
MVQRLLASVAGDSGRSAIKFLCKGPLKKSFVKSREGGYKCLREGNYFESYEKDLGA